jgi:C4-dicarboxylate-specific signal transduction histidine kinase
MQKISPSDVVDMSLQLLRHRLESYRVQVEVERQRRLPQIEADPEQLKEALINLLVNACEPSRFKKSYSNLFSAPKRRGPAWD